MGGPAKLIVQSVAVVLPEAPNLRAIPKPAREKIAWDKKTATLTINAPLSEDETAAVEASVQQPAAKQAIVAAAERCRQSVEIFHTPAELGERLAVPQMALRVQGELALFDDPEVLDYPWELSPYDANPTSAQINTLNGSRVPTGGEIDVDTDSGRMTTRFIADLQRDLGLTYRPEHWDKTRLATWLTKNLPEVAITHASKRAFIAHWLRALLEREDFDLAQANRQRFLIRTLLEARVRELRQTAVNSAYQQTLFGDDAAARVVVGDDYTFAFNPQGYAPTRDYNPRQSQYGPFEFRKHYYGRIGDFDSKEEFECACKLDQWAQQGRMQFWARNLVNKAGCSFFLQKADGRFFPDFVCKLNDDTILVVEYKRRRPLGRSARRPRHRRPVGIAQRRPLPLRHGAQQAMARNRSAAVAARGAGIHTAIRTRKRPLGESGASR